MAIKPWKPASETAADFFITNDNRMVMLTKDVQLLHGGYQREVNQPWTGDHDLKKVYVMYSEWYKTLLGRISAPDATTFMLIFPAGTMKEEAERCCETYMTLLNLVRKQHS